MTRSLVMAGIALLFLAGGAWFLRHRTASPETAASPPSPPNREQISVGRWRKPVPSRDTLTPEQQRRMEQLEAIGYLSGTRTTRRRTVVTRHDPERVWAGVNLYTSGHLAGAILIDMEGRELHRWERTRSRIWEEDLADRPQHAYWRRAALLPDGSILGMFAGVGIFKLDRDSNLVWSNLNGAHHDLEVRPDGTILVLTREARIISSIHPEEPILEDFLVTLDPDGQEIGRISVVEALQTSRFSHVLRDENLGTGDIFHTNTVFELDGRFENRAPWLRRGNILICLRNIDALAVVDPRSGSVVHTMTGAYRRPHDPQILPGGTLLLFDNQGASKGRSRIVEFDPVTSRLAWFYAGEPDYPLESATQGTVSRLPNGNTLITESTNGRVLEVTAGKEVVWEFFNPHRVGDDDEYIASILDLIRIPREELTWIDP